MLEFLIDINMLHGSQVSIAQDPKTSVITSFFINLTAVDCQQREVYQTPWREGDSRTLSLGQVPTGLSLIIQ